MSTLGSNDAVNLFLSWVIGSRGIRPSKGGRCRGWHTKAVTFYGLGAYGAGLQSHFRHILEKNFQLRNDVQERNWNASAPSNRNCGPGWLSLSLISASPWSYGHFWPSEQNLMATKPDSKLAAYRNGGDSGPPSSTNDRNQSPRRNLTNFLLGLNLLVYVAQAASQGRLLLLGAKVNSLIDNGQLWRLLTPAVLHANVLHLLANSYSLNSIGPPVEAFSGPKRFLAVYLLSAVSSTSLSYRMCKSPSVGASGAIFGLVGALTVFLLRHRNIMIGGQRSLKQVGHIILLNMLLGLSNAGIDNWSHVGGLIGGAAVTWLLGPSYTVVTPPGGGKKQLVDRPPISYVFPNLSKNLLK